MCCCIDQNNLPPGRFDQENSLGGEGSVLLKFCEAASSLGLFQLRSIIETTEEPVFGEWHPHAIADTLRAFTDPAKCSIGVRWIRYCFADARVSTPFRTRLPLARLDPPKNSI